MSAFRRTTVPGGLPRQSVLAPLRETQIISSKPVLPAGKLGFPIRLSSLIIRRDPLHHPYPPSRPGAPAIRPCLQADAGDGLR